MRLHNTLNGYFIPIEAFEQIENNKKQANGDAVSTPSSTNTLVGRGPDRVSIFCEAMEIQKQILNSKKNLDSEAGTTAVEQFSAYMKKARSKAQNSSPEKRIEGLQDKLKSLNSQLMAVVSDKSIPEDQKLLKTENIQSQIEAILQQIDGLTTSTPEEEPLRNLQVSEN